MRAAGHPSKAPPPPDDWREEERESAREGDRGVPAPTTIRALGIEREPTRPSPTPRPTPTPPAPVYRSFPPACVLPCVAMCPPLCLSLFVCPSVCLCLSVSTSQHLVSAGDQEWDRECRSVRTVIACFSSTPPFPIAPGATLKKRQELIDHFLPPWQFVVLLGIKAGDTSPWQTALRFSGA